MTRHAELDAVLAGADYRLEPLAGGCVGDVQRVDLADGRRLVAKLDPGGEGGLEVEARMLRDLGARSALRVPQVQSASATLLLMEWLEGRNGCGPAAEPDAARQLAALHAVSGPAFGYDYDTRIGGLVQPNRWSESWLAFFAEQRLVAMAREAQLAGRLDAATGRAVERVAGRLERWLDEPSAPALLHGDVWSGNLLSAGDRVTGFIDPAIYFGHPEVELAFTTLFGTFGDAFFAAYGEVARPLDPDFFDARRHLYNLYPLLVHTRLFGAGYADDVRALVGRFA